LEEMMAYVQRVLEHPNNWTVFSTGLLLRSRLESEKLRTVERAVLQIQVKFTKPFLMSQALVDQYADEDPNVVPRMNYIFALPYPPRWLMKKELGEKYLSYGAAKSALQILEELDMYEDVIDCYRVTGEVKKAEGIVRSRLEVEQTPLLWCLLGDLTDDISAYEKAWELSNHHFARAQRSIGSFLANNHKVSMMSSSYLLRKWAECIKHFELALAINPLYAGIWFTLGCAQMHESDWEKALNSFARVTQLDPEIGEAWNNMGSCYIKQGKKCAYIYN
jgi:tetratricopeptide (TPR) repeat protein